MPKRIIISATYQLHTFENSVNWAFSNNVEVLRVNLCNCAVFLVVCDVGFYFSNKLAMANRQYTYRDILICESSFYNAVVPHI